MIEVAMSAISAIAASAFWIKGASLTSPIEVFS
jgi:hypothetical protein